MSSPRATLALDLGNSTLAAGLFEGERLLAQHSIATAGHSPRQLVEQVRDLTQQHIERRYPECGKAQSGRKRHCQDYAPIIPLWLRQIKGPPVLCSVVPTLTEPLSAALERSFGLPPRVLNAAAAHGLQIAYRHPAQLGSDRLAAALGARKLYPRRDLAVVDCGTATTLTFITRTGELLGGAILPGLTLWARALAEHTAQLPQVELPAPSNADSAPPPVVARDTATALQAGLLYGHSGAIRELVHRGCREAFGVRARPTIIGTGGLAGHFTAQSCFTVTEAALTLHGLQAFAAKH